MSAYLDKFYFLLYVHHMRTVYAMTGLGMVAILSFAAAFNPEVLRQLWDSGMIWLFIGMAFFETVN